LGRPTADRQIEGYIAQLTSLSYTDDAIRQAAFCLTGCPDLDPSSPNQRRRLALALRRLVMIARKWDYITGGGFH